MNTYKIEITTPFKEDIPAEKVKRGDVGIYVSKIRAAIKDMAILEITTPYGITYASPKAIMKDKRIIYRHFLKPEPMMLYVFTPDYDNKPKEEEEPITFNNALANIPSVYLNKMRAIFHK